jgi:DNA-binding response OmpR family regulator
LTEGSADTHDAAEATVITAYPAETARASQNPRSRVADSSAPPADDTRARPRLLWADDDSSLNRFAERLLERSGFEVTVAVDGKSALSALAGTNHDAMVLDLRLPDRPGLSVLREARFAGNTTPAIVLTGFGTPESADEALRLGVVDYQAKPASAARIIAAIRIALRVGQCMPPGDAPALLLHPDVSVALLPVLFNLEQADEHQLRTQLAWAAADETLSFVEYVAAVEALRHLLASPPEPDDVVRRHVGAWLRRAIGMPPSMLPPEVQEFVRLITVEGARTRHLRNEALAHEAGAALGRLSRLVHEQVGVAPDRCRLIAYLQPALRELAHSEEQVAQVGYHLGQNLPSAFDNLFHKLWQGAPTAYRALLTGLVPPTGPGYERHRRRGAK